MKNGKKPLSSKNTTKTLNPDDIFGNNLTVPEDIKKDLEARGLVPRWCDAKGIYENGGYHKRGWVPYKRQKSDTITTSEFSLGRDPEGVVRRGSLILCVKTKEKNAQHKEYLQQKNDRLAGINRQQADELRQFANENQIAAQIHEGYEENED